MSIRAEPGDFFHYLLRPKLRPGLLRGIEGRYGVGAGRYEREGGGETLGLLPLPNFRGLWSAFGSRAPGVANFESRYPPALLAYLESLKPPPLANVLPE